MSDPIRIDATELTLRELSDVSELLGCSLDEAMQGTGQARGIAAIACVVCRRVDPGYTLDQALELRMADLELVQPEETSGEAPGGSNGASPLLSPEPGR